jgi:peptide deformylase
MIRKVVLKGHKALAAKNEKVKDFNSQKVKQAVRDLKDTIKKSTLIGIAAPQIAKNYLIFITNVKNTKYRSFGKEDILRVYINPKITFLSKETSVIYEGCGSVIDNRKYPFGPVKRPEEIEIEAFNEQGEKFSLRCNGILARVIQHEIDHLNGAEFLEKIEDKSKIVSETYYKKNIKNSKQQILASTITKIEYLLP